jgi:hypothetical protein
MKQLKYVKTFESFPTNEIFGLFGGNKEKSSLVDETQKLKSEIQKVFPESIYGNYLGTLPEKSIFKLYQVIDNNKGTMNDSALIDVLKGDESKREELEVEKQSIYWLKSLFSLIEKGSFTDKQGQLFSFDFLGGKTETSLKQVRDNIRSKAYIVDELVRISREKKQSIYQILSNKL